MIEITNTDVHGWEAAIRGMRNPMNSWDRSDSVFCHDEDGSCESCEYEGAKCGVAMRSDWLDVETGLGIGKNDHDLMMRLAKAGTEHSKYRRFIDVSFDVNAPLYWWKEYDTYKVGTVGNSCSTMHKLAAKEFTLDDFSHEHVDYELSQQCIEQTVMVLNGYRERYLKTNDNRDWWQMVQLLPVSYNQRRTEHLNYEVLASIYRQRRNHKLDEWRDFCKWIESLPYSELMTLEESHG